MIDLHIAWFLVITFFVVIYAILDGFDLGVGVLHLFVKNDYERQLIVKAIGPLWHGNEVWLLAVGGIVFAVFPAVYAALLSSFYLIFVLLLFALIFRAISMKFRVAGLSGQWQRLWDYAFGLGSLLLPLLYGLIMGNVIQGIPIDDKGLFRGHLTGFLNLFAILTGFLLLSLFSMHGALYMALNTGGEFLERIKRHATMSWVASTGLCLLTLFITPFISPVLHLNILRNPMSRIFSLVLITCIIYIPLAVRRAEYFRAFLSSSVTIAALTGLAGVYLFPRLIPSSIDPAYDLTIYNAASTARTLTIMLVITLLTMPGVIVYTVYIYRVFRERGGTSREGY